MNTVSQMSSICLDELNSVTQINIMSRLNLSKYLEDKQSVPGISINTIRSSPLKHGRTERLLSDRMGGLSENDRSNSELASNDVTRDMKVEVFESENILEIFSQQDKQSKTSRSDVEDVSYQQRDSLEIQVFYEEKDYHSDPKEESIEEKAHSNFEEANIRSYKSSTKNDNVSRLSSN